MFVGIDWGLSKTIETNSVRNRDSLDVKTHVPFCAAKLVVFFTTRPNDDMNISRFKKQHYMRAMLNLDQNKKIKKKKKQKFQLLDN